MKILIPNIFYTWFRPIGVVYVVAGKEIADMQNDRLPAAEA